MQNLKDLGPEMFCDEEETVISYKGRNYYQACGKVVSRSSEGATTCVKRVGHPSLGHEDFDGRVAVR